LLLYIPWLHLSSYLGIYNTRSAITNPTVKNAFEAGTNGIIIKATAQNMPFDVLSS